MSPEKGMSPETSALHTRSEPGEGYKPGEGYEPGDKLIHMQKWIIGRRDAPLEITG